MDLALVGGNPVRTHPFPAWPSFGEDEANSLLEVLRNGSWGGYSEKVAEFESAFSALHRTKYAVSCANGTVALESALHAVGISCGDEVIVPAITFVATATSVLLCHGVPVFADIDPATLNLSPAAAEHAISPRTRAIIVVHFGGQPADMDAFQSLAERHHIALIEDAAHAHGAIWRGLPVGNFGVAATFSFQGFKLVTSGEGGIVITNSSEVAEKVWGYCNQGRRKGGGWFEHFTLGTNYRITGFQAADRANSCARAERRVFSRTVALILRLHDFSARSASRSPPELPGFSSLSTCRVPGRQPGDRDPGTARRRYSRATRLSLSTLPQPAIQE